MISLLAASNNSFLLLLFDLVASFGSTSTQRQTQLLGNRPSRATVREDTARSKCGWQCLHLVTYSLILPWSSLFFRKGPVPHSVTTGLARSGPSRGDPCLLLTNHPLTASALFSHQHLPITDILPSAFPHCLRALPLSAQFLFGYVSLGTFDFFHPWALPTPGGLPCVHSKKQQKSMHPPTPDHHSSLVLFQSGKCFFLPIMFCLFLLNYSWFTMLCYFLVYSKVVQLYIYIWIYVFFFIIGYYKILNIVSCAV